MAENPYGFTITQQGWDLFARLVGDEKKLEIAGVAFGSGRIESAGRAINLTQLLEPVADGSTTRPLITVTRDSDDEFLQENVSFVCEYRSNGESDRITGNKARDVDTRFVLNEFGVYANDPDSPGEPPILIYYATLGDCPQPVTPYSDNAIDVRRFPVTIALSSQVEVVINYPPVAFVTHQEMVDYVQLDARPELYQEDTIPYVDEVHNYNPEAHPDIRVTLKNHDARISDVEKYFRGDAYFYSYEFDKKMTDGVSVEAEDGTVFVWPGAAVGNVALNFGTQNKLTGRFEF